jgi:hypothetical protein
MKKFIGKYGTWTSYYLGIFFSKLMGYRFLNWLYTPYNYFMSQSVQIQEWAGLEEPWKKVDPQDDDCEI